LSTELCSRGLLILGNPTFFLLNSLVVRNYKMNKWCIHGRISLETP